MNEVDVTPITNALLSITDAISSSDVIRNGYTVANLPAGTIGQVAYVIDATAPTYRGTLTGSGSVVCPVFFDGTNWRST